MLKKFLQLNDQEALEIKTGYKVIFKSLGIFLLIAIPVISVCVVAQYFGFLDTLMYIILILVTLFFVLMGLTAYAQSVGECKLYSKEVKYKRDDGSEGSYVVIDKPKK